ncbi:hypothetical protein J437_LFUL009983 [Ladona fulva]|uniref:Riboflavin transporter n=1 Tax=Ladona fulva TaxID=123851 RepID=A0A8K0KH16_LADFU|nr:hypothetical protein J437_LFUL009983 [Ladona fulva]
MQKKPFLLHNLLQARRFASRAFTIYAVLAVGAAASIALAFTWDKPVGGKSWPIIILTFFFALVGCTSSVLFIPFMAAFRPRSLAAYFTGEGIGGLLPGVIALVQGVGGEANCDENGVPVQPTPLFSSTVYFCCLFVLMLSSIIGFGILEMKGRESPDDSEVPPQPKEGEDKGGEQRSDSDETGTSGEVTEMGPPPLGTPQLAFLLVISGWVCLLANGLLPGIQSYSCAPYGNVAYHLSATLAAMANPATCLLAFFTPLRHTFSLSRSSPPHFKLCLKRYGKCDTTYRSILSALTIEEDLVLIWIGLTVGAVYAKVGAAGALQEADSMQHGKTTGRGPLLWYGGFTQAGSAIGSLIAFLAVTEWNLFVPHSPC